MKLEHWHEWWKHFGSTELRHLLLLWWDPCMAYGVKQAKDEYDSYSGKIGAMLREGATSEQIAAYLASVERDQMGLTMSGDGRDVADRVMEWFTEAMHRIEANRVHPDEGEAITP